MIVGEIWGIRRNSEQYSILLKVLTSEKRGEKKKERKKRHTYWKKRNKTVSIDKQPVFVGKPEESTRKLLDPISGFIKVLRHKFNIKKPIVFLLFVFLYTSNKQLETEN